MNLHELEEQVVLQAQRALDLTLVSSDRLSEDEVQHAWSEARELEAALQRHGRDGQDLVGRLSCVMVDLMCADERIRSLPHRPVAA